MATGSTAIYIRITVHAQNHQLAQTVQPCFQMSPHSNSTVITNPPICLTKLLLIAAGVSLTSEGHLHSEVTSSK